jgi:hypothetical protein
MANMPLAAHEAGDAGQADKSREADTHSLEASEACSTTAHVAQEEPNDKHDCSKSKVSTCAELLAIGHNNKCFDCNTERPLWVNMSYCIFICAPCATIHAEFGMHIKPLSDQSLIPQDFELLEKTGNKAAHGYWLATFDPENEMGLHPRASKAARTRAIIGKYRGKWMLPAERAWLLSQQHAFSTQPAMYGPTYTSFASYESLTSQPQQLSLNCYADGYGYPNASYASGYASASESNNGYAPGYMGGYSNALSDYTHEGYMSDAQTNGFTDDGRLANGHSTGHLIEQPDNQTETHLSGQTNTERTVNDSPNHSNGSANGQEQTNLPTGRSTDGQTDQHTDDTECNCSSLPSSRLSPVPVPSVAPSLAPRFTPIANVQGLPVLVTTNERPTALANGSHPVPLHGHPQGLFPPPLTNGHPPAITFGHPPPNGHPPGLYPPPAQANGHPIIYMSSKVQTARASVNGKGSDFSRGCSPDFVMNSTAAYTKRGRRHRHAH